MTAKISCSVCGGSLAMSKDGCTLQCQECGIVYPIELVKTNCSMAEVAEPVMKQTSGASAEFDSGAPQDLPPQAESSAEGVACEPLLSTWKTSYGFSALGLLVGLLICATPILGIAGLAILACWWFGAMVYAFSIYPSCFSAEPKLHSPQTICFFNLLFGGVIFGCIWNANLTKRSRGYSHLVFGYLDVVVGFLLIGFISFAVSTNPLERIGVDAGAGQGLNETGTSWSGSYRDYNVAKNSTIDAMVNMGLFQAHAENVFDSLEKESNDQSKIDNSAQTAPSQSVALLWQCSVVGPGPFSEEGREKFAEEYKRNNSYALTTSFSALGRFYKLSFRRTAYSLYDNDYDVYIYEAKRSS